MQTQTTDYFLSISLGKEADAIIRSCVHCGFCNATCPTYQLLGDERDSPRGRIYLIKQILEGHAASHSTRTHLDRCLSCHSCETTCPSGVQYGHLLEIGRELVEQQVPRPVIEKIQRLILRTVLPYPKRLKFLLYSAQFFRPILPRILRQQIPVKQQAISIEKKTDQAQKVLLLQGCVQSIATPNTNLATISVLQKLGIEVVSAKNAGCCGAVSQHLTAHQEALVFMRRNIDAWWPYIEQGVTEIVITASGCGAMIKEYGYLLRHDQHYADKAKTVSKLAKDMSEVISVQDLPLGRINPSVQNIAFQSPCTLQHGQQLAGVVESILRHCGFTLSPIENEHLCCGSAGTYSILQAELSQQLLDNKLAALQMHQPELIVTANVGCQLHLQSKSHTPVIHWIELLNDSLI